MAIARHFSVGNLLDGAIHGVEESFCFVCSWHICCLHSAVYGRESGIGWEGRFGIWNQARGHVGVLIRDDLRKPAITPQGLGFQVYLKLSLLISAYRRVSTWSQQLLCKGKDP